MGEERTEKELAAPVYDELSFTGEPLALSLRQVLRAVESVETLAVHEDACRTRRLPRRSLLARRLRRLRWLRRPTLDVDGGGDGDGDDGDGIGDGNGELREQALVELSRVER